MPKRKSKAKVTSKASTSRRKRVLEGPTKVTKYDINIDLDLKKHQKGISKAVEEINGVLLKAPKKLLKVSPVEFDIDQSQTPFCVGCSIARVILYTIVKYCSFYLAPDDITMLYAFYIYCITSNIDGIRQTEISYSWLELFINQLNQNSIILINDTISLGYYVSTYNNALFQQGLDPSPNKSYTKEELSQHGINIDRLFEILNNCAQNIANKKIRLQLKRIKGGSNIIQYFKTHPTTQNAILSFCVGNLQILENPPRDGDVTNAFSVSNAGHAMYLYKINNSNPNNVELIIKNSHYFNSNGPPTTTNSGKKANTLKISLNTINPASIRNLTFVEEVKIGGGTKTRKQNKLK